MLSRFSIGAALVFAVTLAASGPAFAAKLLMKGDCEFVVDSPGIFGSSHLKYSVLGGTVFAQNGDGKYCGTTTMDTPFGPGSNDSCFVVENGQLISAVWGNKVSSSSCTLVEATIFATLDATQAAAFAGTGTANLHGQAFLKTVGGDVKTCAGEEVTLMPGLPYFDEFVAKSRSGLDLHADQRAMDLVRHTICDAQGNFAFTGLPSQRWYIVTTVTWDVPQVGFGGMDRQGGQLLQSINLHAGDNQSFLTSRDQN